MELILDAMKIMFWLAALVAAAVALACASNPILLGCLIGCAVALGFIGSLIDRLNH